MHDRRTDSLGPDATPMPRAKGSATTPTVTPHDEICAPAQLDTAVVSQARNQTATAANHATSAGGGPTLSGHCAGRR